MDDSERPAMGITVPDREGPPEGPPDHRLEAGATGVVSVDTSQRLQHTIRFANEATRRRADRGNELLVTQKLDKAE